MMYNRWAKLIKDFYKPKKGHFDTTKVPDLYDNPNPNPNPHPDPHPNPTLLLTKVPDLYDNALYDMVHNRHLQLGSLPEVYGAALQPG